MFGYYDSIKAKQYSKVFTVQDLIQTIRFHPQKDNILQLHNTVYKSDAYHKLKEAMPCITPAGLFRNGKTKNELIQLSGYLYFDIDAQDLIGDLDHYKKYLITNYIDMIHILGKSIGGRGLFFYIKVEGLNADNYESVYNYVQMSIFKDIKTDLSCKNINRSQFIPYDPSLYVNLSSSTINIPSEILNTSVKKRDTQCINKRDTCYTLSVPFLPIDEVLKKIKWTSYEYDGDSLFTIEPMDYFRVYVPKLIEDGRKHSVFRGLVNGIMYNNPDMDLLTIQSFINYVNEEHTKQKMYRREMLRTVEAAYQHVIETGEINITLQSKTIHFNRNFKLTGDERRRIANKINGLIKKYASVKKITDAREQLTRTGKKINQTNISKVSGLSVKTVCRNFSLTPENIAERIQDLNYKTYVQ